MYPIISLAMLAQVVVVIYDWADFSFVEILSVRLEQFEDSQGHFLSTMTHSEVLSLLAVS